MQTNIDLITSKIFKDHIEFDNSLIENVTSDPDTEVIQNIKQLGLTNLENYLIHSTSWHYDNNAIYLTYLVVIPVQEKIVLQYKLDITDTKIEKNRNTYKPRPENLKQENIIRHAFRHLAYLLKHDYENQYENIFNAEQRKYILSVYDEVAEEINSIL